MGSEKQRKENIQYLIKILEKGKDWSEEKLIAMMCIEKGLTPRLVKEYLKIIRQAGIPIDGREANL